MQSRCLPREAGGSEMSAATPQTDRADSGQALSPMQVVDRYLQAFYRGEFETARRLVADGVTFNGPFVQAERADEFFASAKPLRQIVEGHRVVRQWEDGDDVLMMYEMQLKTPTGEGSVLVSEWNTVRAGKVAAARLVFDTAAFRKLVP
jgi:predicted SnoaL-like aldol condensation-catalyzing enzyme